MLAYTKRYNVLTCCMFCDGCSLLQSGEDRESLVGLTEFSPNFGSKKLFLELFALDYY